MLRLLGIMLLGITLVVPVTPTPSFSEGSMGMKQKNEWAEKRNREKAAEAEQSRRDARAWDRERAKEQAKRDEKQAEYAEQRRREFQEHKDRMAAIKARGNAEKAAKKKGKSVKKKTKKPYTVRTVTMFKLKNGGRLEGVVVKETPTMLYVQERGFLTTIPKSDVASHKSERRRTR